MTHSQVGRPAAAAAPAAILGRPAGLPGRAPACTVSEEQQGLRNTRCASGSSPAPRLLVAGPMTGSGLPVHVQLRVLGPGRQGDGLLLHRPALAAGVPGAGERPAAALPDRGRASGRHRCRLPGWSRSRSAAPLAGVGLAGRRRAGRVGPRGRRARPAAGGGSLGPLEHHHRPQARADRRRDDDPTALDVLPVLQPAQLGQHVPVGGIHGQRPVPQLQRPGRPPGLALALAAVHQRRRPCAGPPALVYPVGSLK